ncbi:MAG: hypothetical protein ACJAZK_001837 [Psychroserpens sp.]|jgi:hypothetical protein|uniref:outer membrane beta-barrel protein n=1 Tax=Psychroserpens sp. TaxID=2020870 RepID=UPI0039E39626
MKYTTTLCSLFLFFSILKSNAQSNVDFGIKGGLNLTFFKIQEAQFGDNIETEAGFYGGIFADIEIDETVSLQPELLYIQLNDFRFINAPIYAKFHLSDKLSFMAGPSLNYFFDFFTNKFKVRGDIATAYNITESIDIHMKFVMGFNEVAPNGLFFGAGYTF